MRLKLITGAGCALALAVPLVAAGNAERFSDIRDHRYRQDVITAAEEGWFRGYDDGTFRPNEKVKERHWVSVLNRAFPEGITRAQFAALLAGGKQRLETLWGTDTYAGEGECVNCGRIHLEEGVYEVSYKLESWPFDPNARWDGNRRDISIRLVNLTEPNSYEDEVVINASVSDVNRQTISGEKLWRDVEQGDYLISVSNDYDKGGQDFDWSFELTRIARG